MTRPRSYRVCKGQITADLLTGRRGHPDGWDSRPPTQPPTADTRPPDPRSAK